VSKSRQLPLPTSHSPCSSCSGHVRLLRRRIGASGRHAHRALRLHILSWHRIRSACHLRDDHRGALSALYCPYMPPLVPPPGAGSNGTAPASRPPRAAPPPPPLGAWSWALGPKKPKGASRSRFIARSLVGLRITKLDFSEPFLDGDEVNISSVQRAPSHRTRTSTAIAAV
jgi:hypothetical protein